ncbi:hypothetical protein NUU61_001588 [Penicillium alfredii]|uniref:Phosphoribosyltransferase domain-containing protein n=1 Tax=Penicillium alfredii TaxID=1506179 RepID=A0A9W9G1L3_9EURO|nr:uncharacterized protein NUU61_001588 [Penicillium alfredii]KAJ5110331.1 hypothetical protein NUU61_001588 [Penicillium alfredii]
MSYQNKNSTDNQKASGQQPMVIGLYGLPGSGKTFILDHLRQTLDRSLFTLYEGSEVISTVTPGGLKAFQHLEEHEKNARRREAILRVRSECSHSSKTALVTGHFMFWKDDEDTGQVVCTESDLATYTHILYLDTAVEVIINRRQEDEKRFRPTTSIDHLSRWQKYERDQLRRSCYHREILFINLSSHLSAADKITDLVKSFHLHTEEYNRSYALKLLDQFISHQLERPETVLVLDADKTIAAADGGAMFWEQLNDPEKTFSRKNPLQDLFSGPLGYSYSSFSQATMLNEEVADNARFEELCQHVASRITLHAEFSSLLAMLRAHRHICAIVVTCGIGRIWEIVLQNENLSELAQVFGGGRIENGLIITPSLKKDLVLRLRQTYNAYTWSFGDSPVDLEMMQEADEAIVVTGEQTTRSKSMDKKLEDRIGINGFQPRQVTLPHHASPRIITKPLPLADLTDPKFIQSIFTRHNRYRRIDISHATEKATAKVLMTPMRDSTISGPRLREAHQEVGRYLAVEYVTAIVGLESYPLQHVQGYVTNGHRLFREKETLIVALMRGGEPMALGVSQAFPSAMFLHAQKVNDICVKSLKGMVTVMLVDSVINTGDTILEFVRHIRSLHACIRIVVVAGVVQASLLQRSRVAQQLASFEQLSFVALRISENSYTGKGPTDTGARLFCTVSWE